MVVICSGHPSVCKNLSLSVSLAIGLSLSNCLSLFLSVSSDCPCIKIYLSFIKHITYSSMIKHFLQVVDNTSRLIIHHTRCVIFIKGCHFWLNSSVNISSPSSSKHSSLQVRQYHQKPCANTLESVIITIKSVNETTKFKIICTNN